MKVQQKKIKKTQLAKAQEQQEPKKILSHKRERDAESSLNELIPPFFSNDPIQESSKEIEIMCQKEMTKKSAPMRTSISVKTTKEEQDSQGNIMSLNEIKEEKKIHPYLEDIYSLLRSQFPEKTKTWLNSELYKLDESSNTEKINLVLDIDCTMVFSRSIPLGEENKTFQDNQNFVMKVGDKECVFNLQARKGLANFLKELTPYCDFYVNSQASKYYILAVLQYLGKYYNLTLAKAEGKSNVFVTSPSVVKNLNDFKFDNSNTLILDDNLSVWNVDNHKNIIPTKKFLGVFDQKLAHFYDDNFVFSFDGCFGKSMGNSSFVDENKLPFCSEDYLSSESQLPYMTDLIKKCFYISKIMGMSVVEAFRFVQRNVLKGCKVFYNLGVEEDDVFIQGMVKALGGEVVNCVGQASHVIYSVGGEFDYEKFLEEIRELNRECFVLNVKWLFDCFFFFKKCCEFSKEY